eukprot:6742627-Prymnesium_polylepis.1
MPGVERDTVLSVSLSSSSWRSPTLSTRLSPDWSLKRLTASSYAEPSISTPTHCRRSILQATA